MDKSLELLNVNSAGVENTFDDKTDNEVYDEAVKIKDLTSRIEYLKSYVNKSDKKCLSKSTYYLISLVKVNEPELAFIYLFKIIRASIIFIDNYLLYADLAIEQKSWLHAKAVLEAAIMLCPAIDEQSLTKIRSLLSQVQEKILNNEEDSSLNRFRDIEAVLPNVYWVLEQLYYKSEIKLATYYPFKLLNLFPNDYEIHKAVFKGLSLIDYPMIYEVYIGFLNKNTEVCENYKNLYLGLIYYNLSRFEQSIQFLSKVPENDKHIVDAYIYLSLIYLLKEDVEKASKILEKLKTSLEPIYLAISFIHFAILGIKVALPELQNHNEISYEINKIVFKLLKLDKEKYAISLINKMKKIDIDSSLPNLIPVLVETFIKEKKINIAKELLQECNHLEKHRLNSWIYRIEGNDDLANRELIEYRSKCLFSKPRNKSIQFQLMNIDLPEKILEHEDEILNAVEAAYSQIKMIKEEIQLESGINKNTCFEASCQDCCKKTFPRVSFVEYLYMRKWLDKQDEKFRNKIYEESNKLIKSYEEQYKTAPKFIIGKDVFFKGSYPRDYTFTCPFLQEDKCTIYPAQPFTCRTYGYSLFGSANGVAFKGCNYFFEQMLSATALSPIRKVINMNSHMNFVSELDKKLINKHILASIPVWFAHSHEEIMEIVKDLD